ncbi:unnamed protein product, partial [marine sediment metagenome]
SIVTSMKKLDYEGAKKHAFSILKTKLVRDLDYHNLDHTQDMVESAVRIYFQEIQNAVESTFSNCKELFPFEESLLLLKTGAAYHDTGFSVRYKENEQAGAGIAKGSLARYGYKKKQIENIAEMIMATQLPQNPKTKLEEILCDADLDNFGRDDFFDKGKLIRKELEGQGIKMSDKDWYNGTLKLLENHSYFTESAKKLRQEKKEENIKKT